MNPEEYEIMRRVEEEYWWYAALRSLVVQTVTPLVEQTPSPLILDAGCGTGGMAKILKETLPSAGIVCMDYSPEAIAHTRERGLGLLARGDVERLPFPAESFDLVVSLDVLYTRGLDDRRAVQEICRVLKPEGRLVLNLAAFDFLRGEHDRAVNGERRYTASRVRALLRQGGLEAERLTYWNASMFPPVAAARLWSRLRSRAARADIRDAPRSDLKPLPAWVNRPLRSVVLAETVLLRRASLPFGTSVFAVARRNGVRTGDSRPH
jgi:SAM-dependent methyltransferase